MKSDFLHRFIHSLDKGELVSCKESSFLNEGKWQAQRTILFTALLNQKSQSETIKSTAPILSPTIWP
jgi:hypothetical protein